MVSRQLPWLPQRPMLRSCEFINLWLAGCWLLVYPSGCLALAAVKKGELCNAKFPPHGRRGRRGGGGGGWMAYARTHGRTAATDRQKVEGSSDARLGFKTC